MQTENSIHRALSNSWADKCGVNLQANPEFEKNYSKFTHGINGANSSMVPDKIYNSFKASFEDGKIDVGHIDDINYLS